MRLTQWGQSFYEFGFEFLHIDSFHEILSCKVSFLILWLLTQICNRYFVKFKVSEETDAISHFFWLRCVRYNSKKPVFLYVAGVIQLLNLSFSHQVGGQQHQNYFFLHLLFPPYLFFKMRLVQFYNKNSSELKVGAQLGENGDVVELSIGSALEFIESGPAAWKMVSRYICLINCNYLIYSKPFSRCDENESTLTSLINLEVEINEQVGQNFFIK